jgi:hypothetical protein
MEYCSANTSLSARQMLPLSTTSMTFDEFGSSFFEGLEPGDLVYSTEVKAIHNGQIPSNEGGQPFDSETKQVRVAFQAKYCPFCSAARKSLAWKTCPYCGVDYP